MMPRQYGRLFSTALLGLAMLASVGCNSGVSSTGLADFKTNKEIEAAAADPSFPDAAEAGIVPVGYNDK